MRSSRIARNTARVIGAVAISAALLGAASAPAHADAHGVRKTSSITLSGGAHGV